MGELVPDTPRGTAEPHANQSDAGPAATQFLDSHGQSYLLDLLQGDSSRRTSSQGPSASLRCSAPSAGPPRIAGNVNDDVDQLDDDDDDNAEHSVPDSQQLRPPDDEVNTLQESLPVATPAGGRPLLRSQSALVLGPDDPSGYSDHEPGLGDLGETQAAHSLDDDDSWRSRGGDEGRRRSSGGRESSRASLGGREHEREADDEGEDDVSMDMTRAVGRVLPSQDGANELAPRASDSQKENPPSYASARSQSGHPPFSLSVQTNVDDASGAPSSSPAVAQHLLASRRPPTRKTSPGIGPVKPASSADKEGIARSSASGRAGSSSSKAWSTSMSGPETSTPAFANVAPPAPPVTATRTLPVLTLAHPDPLEGTEPLTRSSTLPPAPLPRRAQPAALVDPGLFASSAAMKAKVPEKKKRRAEAWDGISQSDESVRAGESLAASAPDAEADADADAAAESATLPPTLVHEAGELGGGPSGAAGGTREEEEGEPLEQETPLNATVRHGAGAGDGSMGSSLPASAGPVAEDEADESSLDPLQRRNPNPLFFDNPTATASSSGSSPGSRSPVKANAATASSKGKNRLSDISELKSSLETPSQAIEVPATQTQYDALRPASLKTQDVEVDKSWHASFQHDTSTDSAATHRQSAPAPATRALKRVAPPPTPVADHHASTSSSASTSRPLARLASPHDADADADTSTVPQPTQRLPESSPEVPLHRAADARARSPFPLPRQVRTGPSGKGVVVPDSDGPTQEDQQLVAVSGRAVAAAKAGRAEARSRAPPHDVAMEVDEPMLEQEFGGGFDDGKEDQEMRDEGGQVEEDQEDELRAPVSAVKGKGKAKAKPKPKPVQRAAVEAPEPVKKVKKVVAPPPPKGKGKAKASSRASTSSRRRSRDDKVDEDEEHESGDALDLLHETNYSAPPALKNSKGRLARSTARPPIVKKDKGKRRASATPPPLDEDDEDAPSPRKKRKVPATPVVEIPARRRESTVSSPARKAPSSRTKSEAKKRVAAPPSTAAKKRPRRSSASATPARADSPEPPVAGPSRARLRSMSRSEPARTPSPALTTDSKPSIKSRLLPTAPFTRVLAFWRDGDTGYYPGTIVALVGGKFDVLFDDGSRGKILADEIRRCELVEDDRCTSWDHEPDTETQAGSLARELVVTSVERDAPSDDEAAAKPGEGLAADDVLVVRAGTRTLRLPVSAIRISPRNALQLDDRRLTDDELALFEGKERPRRTALQRLDLVKAPKAPAVDEMRRVPAAERDRLFGRTAFIVTTSTAGSIAVSSASSSSSSAAWSRKQLASSAIDRKSLIKQLEEHGATIIDWQHLFRVKQPAKDDASPVLEFRKADFRHVEEIFLLTNRACQTSKYLVSLALGVPCLSLEFAVQSMAAGALLDWRPYLLTAGFLHDLGTYGLGSQLRALGKTEYGLESLAAVHAQGGVFMDKKFVVVMRKGDKAKSDTLSERSYAILALLTCASAHLVHFVATPSDARAAQGYDYVFLEDDGAAPPKLLKAHRGLVNMVWLKQCLMAGRLLPAERMRQVDE